MKKSPVTIVGKFYKGYTQKPVYESSEFVDYSWTLSRVFSHNVDIDGKGKAVYWCEITNVAYDPKTATIELKISVKDKCE